MLSATVEYQRPFRVNIDIDIVRYISGMQHLDIYNFENHDTLLLASGPFTLPWDTAADIALQELYANGSDTALDQGEGLLAHYIEQKVV